MKNSKAFVSLKCTGCGVCISKCPEKALEFYTENYSKKARCIADKCNGCGLCVPHCQFKAISMK